MDGQVCALIVTHNRKVLLEECVRAVLAQTHGVARVFVIDNASTDGTGEMLAGSGLLQDARVEHVMLSSNLGGAGGFRRGMELGYATGVEWLWLMDDDTIPAPTALEELLAARARFPADQQPISLSSKVQWTDGTLHPMNFPTVKRITVETEQAFLAAECATISLRWASFVSLLLHRSAIEEHGFPHGDYFIWNDDTEYTARILRDGFGILVPQSVVTHKTVRKHSPMDAPPERSYFQVRNVLWMILRSPAWRTDEKLKIGLMHFRWMAMYLWRARFAAPALQAVWRGLRDGLFVVPRK